MLDCLEKATCYHGMYPHFMHGETGATNPFSRKDDGADLVESAFLFQGLLCARAYFDRRRAEEKRIRDRITYLWSEAEWDWYTQGGRVALTWHWSATNGFALNHHIRGWNECLITYVLAASAPRYAMPAEAYHEGWAKSRQFVNGRSFEGVELPLGPDWGGPLFFAHYSFCGIDPRGLERPLCRLLEAEPHAYAHQLRLLRAQPARLQGLWSELLGPDCRRTRQGLRWACAHQRQGRHYAERSARELSLRAEEAMAALRHFHDDLGDRIWGRFGFVDGFSEQYDWYADSFLAISQGPIVVMIENYRSGLIWKLFMSIPEIQAGMKKLGFRSPAFHVRGRMTALDDWIEEEARFAAGAMLRAISATHLVKERPGFGQRIVPRRGIGAGLSGPRRLRSRPRLFLSLVPGFGDRHRRVARGDGHGVRAADRHRASGRVSRVQLARRAIWTGESFCATGRFREKVQPSFLQYVRPDAEIAAVLGGPALAEARVNADGIA